MKNNLKKYLPHLISFLIIFMPIIIFADSSAATIKNPLKSDDVTGILKDILNIVVKVGAIVVVFFIIWSGYKFVTSRGNEGELSKAKDMFWATIIGGAILLGADVIATVVVNTVETTVGK